jgi:cell division inhibitor SulA
MPRNAPTRQRAPLPLDDAIRRALKTTSSSQIRKWLRRLLRGDRASSRSASNGGQRG